MRVQPSCRLLLAAAAAPHAQGRGGGAWSTVGGDAQRTGWVRTDPRITKESAAKGLQLLWKRQLQKPSGGAGLTQPVLLPNIISYKGFKALAYLGGPADTVYSIDYDLNRMFWETRLSSASKGTAAACAGGSIAVTRAAALGAPGAAGRGGRGAAGGPAAHPHLVQPLRAQQRPRRRGHPGRRRQPAARLPVFPLELEARHRRRLALRPQALRRLHRVRPVVAAVQAVAAAAGSAAGAAPATTFTRSRAPAWSTR